MGAMSSFLPAARGEPVPYTPVWFMRQAGRSLPEYREIRANIPMLESCRRPELVCEITLQPVRRHHVDAAILFSDIVVPLEAMGIEVEIAPGVGPVIDSPIRSAQDVDRLRPFDPEEGVPFVLAAVRALVEQLDVPLIGFGGAPFTLACYLVEGGPSKDHARTKALMASDPATWDKLMDRLSEAILGYLRGQVAAGVAAVQLFDSWAGSLAPHDYRAHVAPAVTRILGGLAGSGVPRIHFGVGTGELLELMHGAGTDVMGIDWRVPLRRARQRLGEGVVLQGNLDPALCLAPFEVARDRAHEILGETGGRRHVFNLGHGVLPSTDPDTLARLVDAVHEWGPR